MYAIYAMLLHGEMALYPALLWELCDLTVPQFVKAIFARKAGRMDHLGQALNTISDQIQRQDGFARVVHEDDQRNIRWLQSVVEQLTARNNNALRDMVQPIGRTARSLSHFEDRPEHKLVIDEPLAEAMRSPEEVVVGDPTNYTAKMMGVDRITGACRVEIEGVSVRGKITDPVREQPGNIYTHALDTAADVRITAKPITKDGVIKTLFISDAGRA
jgi:hypothetical protein